MLSISLQSEESLFLTPSLPPLDISGSSGQVRLSIYVQGLSTPLYSSLLTVGAGFSLPLRDIITLDLETHSLPCRTYIVECTDIPAEYDPDTYDPDNPESVSLTLTALYSRGTLGISASEFASSNFLTLSPSKLLPVRDAFDSLSLWSSQAGSADVEITYSLAGQSHTMAYSLPVSPGVTRLDIDFSARLLSVDPDAVPVTATVSAGSRSMSYHFIPRHPSAAISYLNSFLSPEHIFLFGSWRRTGKVTHEKAQCASRFLSRSVDISPEFEITSHPLTFRQSYLIPEIAICPSLYVYLFAEGSPLALSSFKAAPVTAASRDSLAAASFAAMPSEGSLDASPDDPDAQAYTLKVIAAETPSALGYRFSIPRIFTHHFQPPFI